MICGCKNILWCKKRPSKSRESQILKNYAKVCLHKSTLAWKLLKLKFIEFSILSFNSPVITNQTLHRSTVTAVWWKMRVHWILKNFFSSSSHLIISSCFHRYLDSRPWSALLVPLHIIWTLNQTFKLFIFYCWSIWKPIKRRYVVMNLFDFLMEVERLLMKRRKASKRDYQFAFSPRRRLDKKSILLAKGFMNNAFRHNK